MLSHALNCFRPVGSPGPLAPDILAPYPLASGLCTTKFLASIFLALKPLTLKPLTLKPLTLKPLTLVLALLALSAAPVLGSSGSSDPLNSMDPPEFQNSAHFSAQSMAKSHYWDCSRLSASALENPRSVFLCSDSPTLVIHVKTLKLQGHKFGFAPDQEWVQLQFGQLEATGERVRPESSCLSAVHGDGGAKSHVQTGRLFASVSGGVSFGFLGFPWLRTSMTMTSEIQLTGDQQMEFACDATEGQTLQILSSATEYRMWDWRWRAVEAGSRDAWAAQAWPAPDWPAPDWNASEWGKSDGDKIIGERNYEHKNDAREITKKRIDKEDIIWENNEAEEKNRIKNDEEEHEDAAENWETQISQGEDPEWKDWEELIWELDSESVTETFTESETNSYHVNETDNITLEENDQVIEENGPVPEEDHVTQQDTNPNTTYRSSNSLEDIIHFVEQLSLKTRSKEIDKEENQDEDEESSSESDESEDDADHVTFGPWHDVPEFTIADDIKQMMCVTDPSLLTCDDF